MARVVIEVSKAEHDFIKMVAAAQGVSVKELFISLFRKKYHKQAAEKQLNKLTKKVIEDAEKGKNIIEHKNIDEMFEYLRAL